jgi:hypothetical protein
MPALIQTTRKRLSDPQGKIDIFIPAFSPAKVKERRLWERQNWVSSRKEAQYLVYFRSV